MWNKFICHKSIVLSQNSTSLFSCLTRSTHWQTKGPPMRLHSATVRLRTVNARARLIRHRRWLSREKTRSVSETFLRARMALSARLGECPINWFYIHWCSLYMSILSRLLQYSAVPFILSCTMRWGLEALHAKDAAKFRNCGGLLFVQWCGLLCSKAERLRHLLKYPLSSARQYVSWLWKILEVFQMVTGITVGHVWIPSILELNSTFYAWYLQIYSHDLTVNPKNLQESWMMIATTAPQPERSWFGFLQCTSGTAPTARISGLRLSKNIRNGFNSYDVPKRKDLCELGDQARLYMSRCIFHLMTTADLSLQLWVAGGRSFSQNVRSLQDGLLQLWDVGVDCPGTQFLQHGSRSHHLFVGTELGSSLPTWSYQTIKYLHASFTWNFKRMNNSERLLVTMSSYSDTLDATGCIHLYIYVYRFQHAHSAFFHTVARLVSARAMVSLTIWPMWKGWPTASHKITQAHRAWRAFTRHISGQTSIGKPWHTPVGRDTA